MSEEQVREAMYDIAEAIRQLNPKYSRLVRSSDGNKMVSTMVVECTLPLDVETAVLLQIAAGWAVTEPGLHLTILARLEGE